MRRPSDRVVVYRFGLFEAHPSSGELLRQGERVRLQDQPFRMLVLLLQRPAELITQGELREKLWPEDTFVEFDSSLKVALKKIRDALGDDADNPRFIQTLPRRGYRFIAPVSTEPRDEVPEATVVSRRPSGLGRQLAVAVLAGLTIAVVIGVGRMALRSWAPSTPVVPDAPKSAVVPRRSVAVMELRNASGDRESAWLSTAIPEMLSTELAAGEELRLIPGEEVARMKRELRLENAGSLAKDQAIRAGKNLKVDVIVVGSFTALESRPSRRMRVDLRLQDAKNGEIVAEVAETGNEQQLFDLISQAGTRLRDRLGVPGVSPTEEASVRAALPSNPEAARLYAQGVGRLRVLDAIGARDLLEQAVSTEPGFSLSHLALMSSWKLLGYDQKARSEAKIAFDLSTSLSRPDRLRIEGRYHEVSGEIDQAIAAYRALFALSPDSLEDGLLLAGAQGFGGKRADSLATIDALRRLPEHLSSDPRIDMQQARLQEDVRDYLAFVRRAAEKANRQGAPLLQAKAETMECNALHTLGQAEEAVKVCETALHAFSEAGNPLDSAQTVRFLGDIRLHQGRLAEALALHQRALAIDQKSGNDTGCAVSLNELALDFEARGDLRQAEKLYRQSYALFLKVGHRSNAAVLAFNVGGTLLSLGQVSEAEKLLGQSLDLSRQVGGKRAEAGVLDGLAELDYVRGNLESARRHAETSVAQKRQSGDQFALVVGLGHLSKILVTQGDVTGARQKSAEALSIAEKIGARQETAKSHLALAQLDLEAGLAAQAEPAIRDVLEVFLSQRMRDDGLQAYLALSRCLLAQGKTEEAQSTLNQAREIYATSQNRMNRLRFSIAQARTTAARSADPKTERSLSVARSQLLMCIRTARNLGMVALEYEARLALGEIMARTEPAAAAAKNYVTDLEKDAHARGFELIAHQAAKLP